MSFKKLFFCLSEVHEFTWSAKGLQYKTVLPICSSTWPLQGTTRYEVRFDAAPFLQAETEQLSRS